MPKSVEEMTLTNDDNHRRKGVTKERKSQPRENEKRIAYCVTDNNRELTKSRRLQQKY